MLNLQTKTFAWKRDVGISSELQMLKRWSRQFLKVLIKFCKAHEKELPLNDQYDFLKSFNFSLLLTFNYCLIYIKIPIMESFSGMKLNLKAWRYFANSRQNNGSFIFLQNLSYKCILFSRYFSISQILNTCVYISE